MPLLKPKSPKQSSEMSEPSPSLAVAFSMKRKAPKKMAEGGMVPSTPPPAPMDEENKSIVDAIMHKNKVKMAEGGMVDLDTNNEEQPNGFYDHNEHDALDEDLDSTMDGMSDPMDSNEDSIELEDEDSHDMVSKIMKSHKKS